MPPPWESYSGNINNNHNNNNNFTSSTLSQQTPHHQLQRPTDINPPGGTSTANSQRNKSAAQHHPHQFQLQQSQNQHQSHLPQPHFNPQSEKQSSTFVKVNDIVDGVDRITKNIHDYYTTPPALSTNNFDYHQLPPANDIMNRMTSKQHQQPATKVQAHGQITGEGGIPTFKLGGAAAPPSLQQGIVPGRKSRWSVDQLRATDAMIPSQMGTNQFASQRGMTGFGTPRNTTTPVAGGVEGVVPEPVIPLQYGTNQFASQKGMTGFGSPRDVGGKHIHRLLEAEYPEYAPAQIVQGAH